MGKQQNSKRSRQHRKQAIGAGLYANTGHPSHLSDWRRTAQYHSVLSERIEGGDTMENRCPRCKEKVEDKDNFCPKCGEQMKESVQEENSLLEEG